jgi:3-hydroxyisobutyrate dehydrogenase-like beta-hydroxyacid dehydrogenase
MGSVKENAIGFIGLGAMGKPMVGHLAAKLPAQTRIYVFDIVESVVDEICAKFPDKVVKGANAKEVAEKSVWLSSVMNEPATHSLKK